MKSFRIFFLFAIIFFSGCAGAEKATEAPLKKESLSFSPSSSPSPKTKYRLVVRKIIDLRPAIQMEGGREWQGKGWIASFPFGLFSKDGTGYQINLDSIPSEKLTFALREILMDQCAASGYFSQVMESGGGDFYLETELLDFYGNTFLQTALPTEGGGRPAEKNRHSTRKRQFLPYGFASVRLKLFSSGHSSPLYQQVLYGIYQPDLKDAESLEYRNAFGELRFQEDLYPILLWNASTRALQEMAEKIPLALQSVMNSFWKDAPVLWKPEEFTICQLSRDGKWMERAKVETLSSKIKESRFQKAPALCFSRPGEWVLDPYQGENTLLPPGQYEALADHLRKKGYRVERITDIYVYHFMGVK